MILLLFAFTILVIVDLVPMIKERYTKGIITFLVVFFPALTLGILVSTGVEIESLMVTMWKFMKSIGLTY